MDQISEKSGHREGARDRFVRLAERRVTRAIKDLRLIGNLSNRSNYAYSPEDAQKVIRALEAEVKSLRQRFETASDQTDEILFKL